MVNNMLLLRWNNAMIYICKQKTLQSGKNVFLSSSWFNNACFILLLPFLCRCPSAYQGAQCNNIGTVINLELFFVVSQRLHCFIVCPMKIVSTMVQTYRARVTSISYKQFSFFCFIFKNIKTLSFIHWSQVYLFHPKTYRNKVLSGGLIISSYSKHV